MIKKQRPSFFQVIWMIIKEKFFDRNRSWKMSGDWPSHAINLPLIKRTFAEPIANELVSVQPMSGPTGLIFNLDFRDGSKK